MSGWTLFLFLIITLAATLFRITNIQLIEFKGDEAVNLFLASRPLFGHPFPPGGTVSSMGILNPPLINYILFPFTLLSLDPKMISLFIGLVNSFAIGFLFLLFRKYYGLLIAFIATILLAFSPWSILYSRKIWPQDFLLLFLVPWFYSIHKIVIEKRAPYWVLYIAISLLLIQLYLPSLFIVALTTIFLLKQKTSIALGFVFLGLVLGILPFFPFISYQLANNCPDCTALFDARQRTSTTYDIVTFLRPLQIINQGNFSFILGDDFVTFASEHPFVYNIRRVFYIDYLLLPLGMFFFWRKWKNLRFLVFVTLFLPILYFLLRIVPHMHYFIVLTPLFFLFLAFTFAKLLTVDIPPIRFGSLLILALLITVSIGFNIAFFDLLQLKKGLQGDYGSAFVVKEREVRNRLEKYKDSREYQEMFLASFMPRSFVHADSPGGKMLYQRETTEKNLPLLEQRLTEVPEDARIQLELIAYYTHSPITSSTVEYLEKKSKDFPGYRLIFEEVNTLYQAQQVISPQQL